MSKNNPYSPYFYKAYLDAKHEQTVKNGENSTDSNEISVKIDDEPSHAHKKNKRGAVALIIIFICFISTVLCADITTSGVLAVFVQKKDNTDSKTYYAVRLGYFSDKKTAADYSDDIAVRAAAGYIRNDGNYSVIAAVYNEKARAEKVVDRFLKNNNAATILIIEIKPFNSDYLTAEVQARCDTALNTYDNVYTALFDISNNLDNGSLSENDAKTKISELISSVKDSKDAFDNATLNCSHPAIRIISASMSLIVKRLEEIGKEDYVYLSSPVRYAYTSILYDRHDLCNDLSRFE